MRIVRARWLGIGETQQRRRRIVGHITKRTRRTRRTRRFNHSTISSVAAIFCSVAPASAVPIDLTQATPSVSGVTTLHIDGISTLGASYWADFKWNEKANTFDVAAYGEEEETIPPEGFVLIESGAFIMGSPVDELGRADDETEHEVTLTRDFYLAETEVTQGEWLAVMGSNPSEFSGCDDCPVEMVSWYDAVEFCNARSALETLSPAYDIDGESVSWDPTANGYRLPTEAEAEYACRAGSTTAYYNGPNLHTKCNDPNLDEIGWYCGNNDVRPEEVAQKLPNAWGLYDMSGNVHEWCWDWKEDYPSGPATDPTGPESGANRARRSGSWASNAQACRSAERSSRDPESRVNNHGLRPARWATP